MKVLDFHLREADRGRSRVRSGDWRLWLRIPRFWNRSCSPGCRYGTTYEYEGNIYTRDHAESLAVENRGEPSEASKAKSRGCRRQPITVYNAAKGWWSIGEKIWRWDTEVVFAVGGEDNMVQISVMVPLLGRGSVGIGVPRAWTKPWVYNRREFGIQLRGLRPTILIGWDEQAHDMHDFYLKENQGSRCVTCHGPKFAHEIPEPAPDAQDAQFVGQHRSYEEAKDCPGFKFGLPPYVTRVSLIAGWRIQFPRRLRIIRIQNKLFGKIEHTETPLKVIENTYVQLPEGRYVGTVTFYRDTVKRPRWLRPRRDVVYGKFTTEQWMPWPGKGENSWDCGDDGTQEHSELIGRGAMKAHEIGGADIVKVLAGTAAMVLRYRARYGRWDWEPEGVGAMRG